MLSWRNCGVRVVTLNERERIGPQLTLVGIERHSAAGGQTALGRANAENRSMKYVQGRAKTTDEARERSDWMQQHWTSSLRRRRE